MTKGAFHAKPFDQRFLTMGDEAETVYEAVAPLGASVRFGWRKPKGIDFRKLPDVLKHMPDYYATSGYFVEVVGLGRDGILKSVKVEKYAALKVWKRIATILHVNDVLLFVWNSHTHQYLMLPWSQVTTLVARSKRIHGIQKFEVDNKEYHPLPFEWLTDAAAWVEYFRPEGT